MIEKMQKEKGVIKQAVTILIFICAFNITAQDKLSDALSQVEYDVINSIYKDSKTKIFYLTYFDKNWTRYFYESNAHLIDDLGGLGFMISYEEVMKLLTPEVKREIIDHIEVSKPLKLLFSTNKAKI